VTSSFNKTNAILEPGAIYYAIAVNPSSPLPPEPIPVQYHRDSEGVPYIRISLTDRLISLDENPGVHLYTSKATALEGYRVGLLAHRTALDTRYKQASDEITAKFKELDNA
jgi:hypothetical protein